MKKIFQSSYQVLARQFRPQNFFDVVGQEAIVKTLRQAISSNRTAQAYLFCGCRGTGKTTLARLFAKALNCQNPRENQEPCNACSCCIEITGSHSVDVLEIDGASHRGIEDIRQITESVYFSPVKGKYKIYLIDEVHMLTKEAFNALLKTLEEPPAHIKFFFCTTEVHKVPATILSRCQRFNLSRLSESQIIYSLEKITSTLGLQAEKEGLQLVARLAEGSLRDAQSLFDQVISFCTQTLTEAEIRTILGLPDQELFKKLDQAAGRYELAFEIIQSLYDQGKNLGHFLDELAHHFRDHLLLKIQPAATAHSPYRKQQLLDILELLQKAIIDLKSAPSERVHLEMVLLNIIRSHERLNPIEIIEKLEKLEHKISQSPQLPTPALTEKRMHLTEPLTLPLSSGPKPASSIPQEKPKPVQPKVEVKKTEKTIPPSTSNEAKAVDVAAAPIKLEVSEHARMETFMRFAAKELNGTLKMES
jgi:DNA polymerase-3 subunit gamma/tau